MYYYMDAKRIISLFQEGVPTERQIRHDGIHRHMSDKGLLLLINDSWQKIQVYEGEHTPHGFRVISGWYESGRFVPEDKDKGKKAYLTPAKMFQIGPGYRDKFYITPELFNGHYAVIGTFEPGLPIHSRRSKNLKKKHKKNPKTHTAAAFPSNLP